MRTTRAGRALQVLAATTALVLTPLLPASAAVGDTWSDRRGDLEVVHEHHQNRSIDIYSVKASSGTRNGTRYAMASWRLRNVHRAGAPGVQWMSLAFKYSRRQFLIATANGEVYLYRGQADGSGYEIVSCDGDSSRLAPGKERAWARVPLSCLVRATGGQHRSRWKVLMSGSAWNPYGYDGGVYCRDNRMDMTRWLRWRWA